MFARVATFESTDPAADEQLMGQAMEIVKPLIKGLMASGPHGALARPGKSISISFFDTEENAVAAEPVFDEDMPRPGRPDAAVLGPPDERRPLRRPRRRARS